MILTLLLLVYLVPAFLTWVGGSVRLGMLCAPPLPATMRPIIRVLPDDIRTAEALVKVSLESRLNRFDYKYHIIEKGFDQAKRISSSEMLLQEVQPESLVPQRKVKANDIWNLFAIGMVWFVAVPFSLAFKRGNAMGLKKAQLRAQVVAVTAEIEEIRRKEGWTKIDV